MSTHIVGVRDADEEELRKIWEEYGKGRGSNGEAR
jgi:hypothetical protein